LTFKNEILRELKSFQRKLDSLSVFCGIEDLILNCSQGPKTVAIDFSPPNSNIYHLFAQPEKLISIIKSKLGLNKKIFARKCKIKRIENVIASDFLNEFHLMNSTSCAYSYGLYHEAELVAVATFSKGRKMNRLPENERSFELIRFCTKSGVTVTGGLTRLLKYFIEEKKAGDVMTYVDKQFSNGDSFIRAGFKKCSATEPNYFLYGKPKNELLSIKEIPQEVDERKYILLKNSGNVKMIFNPN
jgi:hypothetical protein